MSTEVDKKTAWVKFENFHQPTLTGGDYQIVVSQAVAIDGITDDIDPFTASRSFTVAGERFELKPTDIEAVFPPDGNLGDHYNVLPHIVLNRSTLPWERSVNADQGSTGIPWLALLVFDEDEKPEPQKLTLSDLVGPRLLGAPKFPQITPESWQKLDDALTVINVPYTVLSKIMPSAEELKVLTHVRFGTNAAGENTGEEQAIIISNRLPQQSKTSTAHLVSLEKRFKKVGTGYEFDYQEADDHSRIRLVSLKSWNFTCESPAKSFKQLLVGLDRTPSTLKLPDGTATAKKFFSEGYVAVPQYFRAGHQNLGWFRGPLIPGKNESLDLTIPARTADELVRFDTELAMFDVSYAAAWELGRLLALQDKDFSTSLYQWKRQQAQRKAQDKQRPLHSHLPYQNALQEALQDALGLFIPKDISDWFDSLRKLEKVPFNYLVPDERMLPPESIRFFHLDWAWVDCLADGAFSIGRVASSDHKADKLLGEESPAVAGGSMITGFLMRSEVVAGWPGLLADGFFDDDGKEAHRLTRLRMDRLAPGVLLCLFAGDREVERVDIYTKPETLHFGFSHDKALGLYKKLRDQQGTIIKTMEVRLGESHWDSAQQRTVNVLAWGKTMSEKLSPKPPLTSSLFGLQMVESGDKIIFSNKPV